MRKGINWIDRMYDRMHVRTFSCRPLLLHTQLPGVGLSSQNRPYFRSDAGRIPSTSVEFKSSPPQANPNSNHLSTPSPPISRHDLSFTSYILCRVSPNQGKVFQGCAVLELQSKRDRTYLSKWHFSFSFRSCVSGEVKSDITSAKSPRRYLTQVSFRLELLQFA
jgi:hypothetical protein